MEIIVILIGNYYDKNIVFYNQDKLVMPDIFKVNTNEYLGKTLL